MKEPYLTERDKQLSMPEITVAAVITVVLVKLAGHLALINLGHEEKSDLLLELAFLLLFAFSGLWIWKKKASR